MDEVAEDRIVVQRLMDDGYDLVESTLPVLFTVILVSLDNIQEHLENPFDLVGEDDVVINAEKFVSRLES